MPEKASVSWPLTDIVTLLIYTKIFMNRSKFFIPHSWLFLNREILCCHTWLKRISEKNYRHSGIIKLWMNLILAVRIGFSPCSLADLLSPGVYIYNQLINHRRIQYWLRTSNKQSRFILQKVIAWSEVERQHFPLSNFKYFPYTANRMFASQNVFFMALRYLGCDNLLLFSLRYFLLYYLKRCDV